MVGTLWNTGLARQRILCGVVALTTVASMGAVSAGSAFANHDPVCMDTLQALAPACDDGAAAADPVSDTSVTDSAAGDTDSAAGDTDSAAGDTDSAAGDTDSREGLFQTKSVRQRNQTAADLQKSWNPTAGVARALGVEALTAGRTTKAKKHFDRLRAAHAEMNGSNAVLPNVPTKSLALLGARDGITFGAWKGGPAGTMPILFHFGPHETTSGKGFVRGKKGASADFMNVLRRSAKIWSRRLVDTGARRNVTIDDGTTYRGVKGFVLQVRLRDRSSVSGGVRQYEHGPKGEDLVPYYGAIGISRFLHDNLHDGMASTVAHEIGHALGIGATATKFYRDKYYHHDSHTWTGPNAMRANGGKPVPMQWRDERRWWVVKEPNAPDAERDVGHLGVCTSLMAYCRDDYDGSVPSGLDYGFLADIGFKLVDPKVAAETERYGYAAWGDWAAWGVSVERDLQDNLHEYPKDFTQAYADAFGTRPSMTLAENTSLSAGEAVWKGSLLGVDLGRKRLPPVTGDAKLRVDLGTLDGTVQFSDLTVHIGSHRATRARPFRQTGLSYEIDVTGNNFGDAARRVTGGFYGPAHEEMAGVVNDTRTEVNLLGGFGGIRDGE